MSRAIPSFEIVYMMHRFGTRYNEGGHDERSNIVAFAAMKLMGGTNVNLEKSKAAQIGGLLPSFLSFKRIFISFSKQSWPPVSP